MAWLDDPIQAIDSRPTGGDYINPGSVLIPSTLGFVNPLGITDDNVYYPFNISGSPDSVLSIGMAVGIDPSAPYTVRLAQAGDTVIGQLKTVEYRTQFGLVVCTVATSGVFSFPMDTTGGATAVVLGSRCKGGTIPGTVVNLAAASGSIGGTVFFVDSVNMVCSVLL